MNVHGVRLTEQPIASPCHPAQTAGAERPGDRRAARERLATGLLPSAV